ncbi:MAG: site-specific DNA-methyltransferase [Beijerinckiaceae bacterium]
MLKTPARNTLFYGDNLAILREHIADESVDLIYLDPPFNSNASYNVLFRAPEGHQSQAQIEAFDDTWHWNAPAEQAFDEVMQSGNSDAAEMLRAMRSFLKENDMMAYLTMMAVRLLELHRVLKPTGSLYLHCDPTASHYLKILLDAVFGNKNYRSEISWRRSSAHSDAKQGRRLYGNIRDTLFFYSKSDAWQWNWQYTSYSSDYVESAYRHIDQATGKRFRRDNLTAAKPGGDVSYLWPVKRPVAGGNWEADLEEEFRVPNDGWEYKQVPPYRGRFWAYSKENMRTFANEGRLIYAQSGMPEFKRYLDEMPGVPLQNDWNDISPVIGKQDLGYPTQKPLALLERIVSASSNEGDLILDPFCGCGTTVHAAQKLNRRWIGIDITHLAIHLIKRRLNEAFPKIAFDIVGEPKDLDGARALAAQDKYEFQKWALAMIDAQPFKGGKKGGDGGVDGFLYIKPDGKKTEKVIVSVKGGQSLNPAMVKDLIVTVEQEGAKMGVFLTLEPPTKGMVTQAAAAGFYKTEYGQFPKVQIVTVEALFGPSNPLHLPWQDTSVFKKAKREKTEKQSELDL